LDFCSTVVSGLIYGGGLLSCYLDLCVVQVPVRFSDCRLSSCLLRFVEDIDFDRLSRIEFLLLSQLGLGLVQGPGFRVCLTLSLSIFLQIATLTPVSDCGKECCRNFAMMMLPF